MRKLNNLNMTYLHWVKSYFKRYMGPLDRTIIGMSLIIVALGLWFKGINWITFSFHGVTYVPTRWLLMAPVFLLIYLYSLYAMNKSPRLGFFTRSYAIYYLVLMAFAVIIGGIQYTPLPRIDHLLAQFDTWLGFSTIDWISWSAHHHQIKHLASIGYFLLDLEFFVIPFLLASLSNTKAMNQFLLFLLIGIFFLAVIYYFFPTAAPASVFSSIYFDQAQRDTFIKFYEVHHYLKSTTNLGGMVAFPSGHVLWSITMAYSCRSRWWLFIPIAVINIVAIFSTMLLGFHYLADVIGGIIFAIISIYIGTKVYNQVTLSKEGY